MPKAYLDNHTVARPLPSAIEAMLPFLREHWGSTSAPHQMGQELFFALNKATEWILEVLGAHSGDRFHFFSSNEEAIHHLYLSHYLHNVRNTGKNHLLTTTVEDAPVLAAFKQLEELGCHGKILAVNNQGQLTADVLDAALKPRVSLVSLSWANGLTGVIHPLEDLAKVCKEKGVLLHVDASYAIGKFYLRLEDLPIDYLTFDGSLLHAPKGVAGLIAKEKSPLPAPLSALVGVSVGGVAALAAALDESSRMCDHLCLETARLRDKLERGIVEAIPDAVVLLQSADRLPNCTAIAFPHVASSDALLFQLHRKGVYASCGGGRLQKLSQILIASGVEKSLAQCALSFSLSFETTEEEIDYAIQVVIASVQKLKSLSHHLFKGAP